MTTVIADVENDAFSLLSSMTTEDKLRELARAIAESGVPPKAVTDIFVLKVLLNKHLYKGWDSLKQLAAGTRRQGLFQREFGKRFAERADARRKNVERRPKIDRTSLDRPNAESTFAFRKAVGLVAGTMTDISYAPLITDVGRGMKEWRSLSVSVDDGYDGRGDAAEAAMAALERRLETVSGEDGARTLALVPVDRYLAMALMQLPHRENMAALKEMADAVRTNLRSRTSKDAFAPGIRDLPVGREFVERYLSPKPCGSFGNSEGYFVRHKFKIWNDMLASATFSLISRDVDASAAALSALDSAARFASPELRSAIGRIEPGTKLVGVLRDDDRDAFGCRVCMFGTYEAGRAGRMAREAAAARTAGADRPAERRKALRELLGRDLAIHGGSMRTGFPSEDMWRLARPFGKWRLW